MRPVDIKKFKYKDNMASQRRHNFNVKTVLIGLTVLITVTGIGYTLFYAPWLKITNVTFEGLTNGHQSDVQKVVDDTLNRKVLGLPVGRDILLVRSDSLAADLASQFSFIENVSIQKNYFHTLQVTATERQAEGVWCFGSTSLTISTTAPDCRYFDRGGITFGHAIQSSGVLLLNVNDMRTQSASASLTTVDPRFLKAIQTVVPILTSQDVKVKNITIPLGTYTEFDVLMSDPALLAGASGYLVKFSLDSNIESQLEVFRIFRTQKMTDGTLHPQYIDLRFDDRVYFK